MAFGGSSTRVEGGGAHWISVAGTWGASTGLGSAQMTSGARVLACRADENCSNETNDETQKGQHIEAKTVGERALTCSCGNAPEPWSQRDDRKRRLAWCSLVLNATADVLEHRTCSHLVEWMLRLRKLTVERGWR